MTESAISKVFALINQVVELYLAKFVKKILPHHERFYNRLNTFLRKFLDDRKAKIPDWFTANFITYVRTVFVIPTLLLLAGGYTFFPSVIVILVDLGDFLDGVVARFWVDCKKEKKEELKAKEKSPSQIAASDDEGFGECRYRILLFVDCALETYISPVPAFQKL
jgi:hypothetical protein